MQLEHPKNPSNIPHLTAPMMAVHESIRFVFSEKLTDIEPEKSSPWKNEKKIKLSPIKHGLVFQCHLTFVEWGEKKRNIFLRGIPSGHLFGRGLFFGSCTTLEVICMPYQRTFAKPSLVDRVWLYTSVSRLGMEGFGNPDLKTAL